MVRKQGALRLKTVAAATLSTLALALAGLSHAGEARVARAAPGQSLSRLSQATPAAQVSDYLRQRGADAATAGSLAEVSRGDGTAGRSHVRLEQQVGGKKVWGRYAKATLGANGDLLHVIDDLAPVSAATPQAARINEQQALRAALARLHPLANDALGAGARDGNTTRFAKSAYFHQAPQVTRVLLPAADGSLSEAFEVQTWSQKDNQLHHTVVNGEGLVVVIEERTANDSYNVFTVDPGKGPQTVVQGPGAGNAFSPNGWLSGTQTTINITGNNVNAYLDADSNNRADRGGTTVTGGNFLTAASLTTAPSTTANRAVAVQTLFYLNNRTHDILYSHGFNEAAGNFQVNNFAKGGLGNDPVNAEAQDGGGTNNANFATPNDGSRPRMQMYLWSGVGPTHELLLSTGVNYGAYGSTFGAQLTTTGRTATVVALNDGVAAAGGGTTTDGCEALPAGSLTGRIALVDRGLCSFTVKVKNAQNAGATGVVIANNAASAPFAPGGTDSTVTIPSMMISQADGAALRQLAAPSATMRRKAVQPVQLDGDLDSDIVYHEYGHGLTWRMIGSMSGPASGAIGEGASDVVAFMVNGDDVIGEYAAGNPLGIRRFRYAGYPLTYANVTGAEVHADGEIYAAAMWRLRELWLESGRSNDSLFGHFVDGMNYTPAAPKFENMRNGMLDAINATAGADAIARCTLVWQAFAQYGVGVGASATVLSATSVAVTPSNVARADCLH
ncbi:Zinc metalloprotease (elastase) [Burkholderiales bacterium JOSHI_001]|nr:Zinc metalloprotease (elastase) [Burkholderiales bacterium JOSHI_001]